MSTLLSCLNPSVVPDALSLLSSPSQVEEEDEGIIPYPLVVSLTYPSSRSFLHRYLSDGVVKVAMPGEEGVASTLGRLEYQDLDPRGGPRSKFPLHALIKALMDDLRGKTARFQIKDPYHLVRPKAFHTLLT